MTFWVALQGVGGTKLPMVAVLGSAALLAALATPLSVWAKGDRRARYWSVAPLILAAAAFLMGGRVPGLHTLVSTATAATLGRNALAFRGAGRWSSGFACVAWIGSMVSARVLFG